MATIELVQERLISGRGVLRIPEAKKKNRFFILYCDVIREPKSKYLNRNWNPDRSRYGTICYVRNNYVIGSDAIEFPRQSWDGINDVSGQTLIALKCVYDVIFDTFSMVNAFTSAGLSNSADLIKNYENLRMSWDEIRVLCYADTALQLRLYTQKYDSCDEDKDKDTPPPPPPPPLPAVEPGTGIGDISGGYDGGDDNGNTEPYDGDEVPPPAPELPGERCQAYRVTLKVYGEWGDPDGGVEYGVYKFFQVVCYGEIELIRITPGVGCRLLAHGEPPTCVDEAYPVFISQQPQSPLYPDPEITGFEEV